MWNNIKLDSSKSLPSKSHNIIQETVILIQTWKIDAPKNRDFYIKTDVHKKTSEANEKNTRQEFASFWLFLYITEFDLSTTIPTTATATEADTDQGHQKSCQ